MLIWLIQRGVQNSGKPAFIILARSLMSLQGLCYIFYPVSYYLLGVKKLAYLVMVHSCLFQTITVLFGIMHTLIGMDSKSYLPTLNIYVQTFILGKVWLRNTLPTDGLDICPIFLFNSQNLEVDPFQDMIDHFGIPSAAFYSLFCVAGSKRVKVCVQMCWKNYAFPPVFFLLFFQPFMQSL